jgi:hypothetical protein
VNPDAVLQGILNHLLHLQEILLDDSRFLVIIGLDLKKKEYFEWI